MVYKLNMAESKSGSFSKVVLKKAGRAKERILQNLGKADRTTDELFEVYQNNFNRQQNSATRLQKELKNYISSLRALQSANKGLLECLTDIYEPEWPGHEQIPLRAQALELSWEDLCHKLNDQVTIPLSTYLTQFSEIRAKIDKRGRKLVDYDGTRHTVESLLKNAHKKDDIKVAKAREQMEEAKRLYEVLNKELLDELPALYDSRIPFLISTLQTLFEAETIFHNEYSQTHAQFKDMIDKLSVEAQKGSYHTSARQLTLSSTGSIKPDSNQRPYEETDSNVKIVESSRSIVANTKNGTQNHSNGDTSNHNEALNSDRNDTLEDKLTANTSDLSTTESDENKKSDEAYDIPIGATTIDLPPGVLYKVRATYKYAAEDGDELSFESGEIIRVIEYENPEEQEEGWLMGLKESTGEKGLFPANFTRLI